MSGKTKAQLEAENAALREANKKLRTVNRSWLSAPLFENTRKQQDTEPDWQTSRSFRFIVSEDLKAGDPLWLDLNLRIYDPETCPLKFGDDKTKPDYIVGVRACSPNWANRREAEHQAATAS